MKWFDENDWFDIENVDVSDTEKLKSICEWFTRRTDCDESEREVFITDTHVIIEYTWEDSCRGCYMGTIHEKESIPNEIFFSNYPLWKWREEEKERREKEEAIAKKRKAAVAKATKKRKAEREAIAKEEDDCKEYLRLKEKYEEND